jgi:hypothetical protein
MQSQGTKGPNVTTFMAECFWPGVTAQKVARTGDRVRRAAHAIGCDESRARYLGSILVPTDEIALLLLEAASITAATELAQQASIPSERILEIVRLGAFFPSGRDNHSDRQRSVDESSP